LGKNLKLAEWLLESGAVIQTNENGETPLHWACKYGHLPMVEFLVANMGMTDVLQQDAEGFTCLHWAKDYDHKDIIKFLNGIHIFQRSTHENL